MDVRASNAVSSCVHVVAHMLSATDINRADVNKADVNKADIDAALLFPPLKKGGRGDLLLLFAEAKQQQIPPSIATRSPTPFFKGGESKGLSEVADMADVTNTAIPNVSDTATAMATTALATMTNVTAQFPPLQFPPLKKGGRGDLLLLFAEAKQQPIPPSIATRSPTPFFKGGRCNNHHRAEFSGSRA